MTHRYALDSQTNIFKPLLLYVKIFKPSVLSQCPPGSSSVICATLASLALPLSGEAHSPSTSFLNEPPFLILFSHPGDSLVLWSLQNFPSEIAGLSLFPVE